MASDRRAEKSFWDEAEETAEFFEDMRDWAVGLSRDMDFEIPFNNRVGLARLAVDAEIRRGMVLGIKRPEAGFGEDVVVRVETMDGLPPVRPPIPAKYQNDVALLEQRLVEDQAYLDWLKGDGAEDGEE